MLRTGHSKLSARWSSSISGSKPSSLKDLEKATAPQVLQERSRSRVDFLSPCSSVARTVLCIFALFMVVSSIHKRRIAADTAKQIRWDVDLTRNEHGATRSTSSDDSSSAITLGKPLELSSLSHPPRIEGLKLLSRLEKLEASFHDVDLNEDAGEIGDDLRHTYSLSRWPPLISHIQSSSGHVKEEYSAEVSDLLLCSTSPCKLLLPAWVLPLSPARQMVQVQGLIDVARLLGRILVLPNAGPVSGDTGDSLLGLGTCHRYPFARYFDTSKLLRNGCGEGNDQCPKSAVSMQAFSEWVKHRPVRPSARTVVLDRFPSNETHGAFLSIGSAEIRIDGRVERGRGKHKNCLSFKASKLRFESPSPFLVYPSNQYPVTGTTLTGLSGAEVPQYEASRNLAAFIRDAISFLKGGARSPSGASCSTASSSPCPEPSVSLLEIGDPDVLIVEWGLGAVLALSNSSSPRDDGESSTLDYSHRIYSHALRIVSVLRKPLTVLRFGTDSATTSNIASTLVDRADLDDLEVSVRALLKDVYAPFVAGSISSGQENSNASFQDDPNAAVNAESSASSEDLGTVWLGRGFSHSSRLVTQKPPLAEGAEDKNSEDANIGSNLTMISQSTFTLVDVFSITAQQTRPKHRKHREVKDEVTQIILEDIVEQYADRVLDIRNDTLGNGENIQ